MRQKTVFATITAAVLMLGSSGAHAATIIGQNSLPGGTALPMPTSFTVDGNPVTVGGVTHAGSPGSFLGSVAGYAFNNGQSAPPGTISNILNVLDGSLTVKFANPIAGLLAEINWGSYNGVRTGIAAFDATGSLLETFELAKGPVSFVPATSCQGICYGAGYYGILRGTADITTIEFYNGYIGYRNATILENVVSPAVPEPATWAMMIAGFGMIGGAMRRRAKTQRRVEYI